MTTLAIVVSTLAMTRSTVPEFHHAAAPSYQKLLNYYHPCFLLGLTATPERMDGKSILPYFGNRIAAEIRLPEAIDRKLLCPFQYFGVTDTVDLNTLKWSAGGYDKGELSRVYTISGAIAISLTILLFGSFLEMMEETGAVKTALKRITMKNRFRMVGAP